VNDFAELLEGDGVVVVGVGLLHHPDRDRSELILADLLTDHSENIMDNIEMKKDANQSEEKKYSFRIITTTILVE
jgi:hypothetical protein